MKTTKVHGWEGTGTTIKEAKEDAINKIEAAAKGYFTPTIIQWRGLFGVVYRELENWCYMILREGEKIGAPGPCIHTYKTKDETIRFCRAHLAQNAWKHEDKDELPAVMKEDCTQEQKDSQVYWQRWQMDYRRLRDEGKNDQEAHREAQGRRNS